MESLIEMKNIKMVFPGVVALDNVNFDVKPGEVHVLLGENGAGKSTLMKILSGAYHPTEGVIIAGSRTYHSFTPKEAMNEGISIIYQELSVVNELSITENIFIGKLLEKKFLGIPVIDSALMRKKTTEILETIGLNYKPETSVGSLSISEKQMVEIAKAVAFNSKVIIMDEPTSSLTSTEVAKLFEIIKNLQKKGCGIIYISHRLSELKEIGNRVTVLKDGSCVGTRNIGEVTVDELISMMVGRTIQERFNSEKSLLLNEKKKIFEVSNLTRKDKKVKNASFFLYEGEILGFSGLVGAGRSELMNAIYGAEPIEKGEVFINGKKMEIKGTYNSLKNGLALLTENRRETGILKNFSIKNNISIASNLKSSKMGGLYGLLDNNFEKMIANNQKDSLSIKCSGIEQNITKLSGGNQQKVILGKWLASNPKIIIFDEPTKGIDVGTKSEIYKLLRALAEQKIGIIVVSSELPELLSLCDRIIVFGDGKIKAEFDGQSATEEKLIKAAATTEEEALQWINN